MMKLSTIIGTFFIALCALAGVGGMIIVGCIIYVRSVASPPEPIYLDKAPQSNTISPTSSRSPVTQQNVALLVPACNRTDKNLR